MLLDCAQSVSQQPKLYFAPGNAGTAAISENVSIKETQIDKLLEFAQTNTIDITFVGPEAPLVLGIVDKFNRHNCTIIEPSKAASQKGQKIGKTIMEKYNIPTASFETFTDFENAKNTYFRQTPTPLLSKPMV